LKPSTLFFHSDDDSFKKYDHCLELPQSCEFELPREYTEHHLCKQVSKISVPNLLSLSVDSPDWEMILADKITEG
jgi:hypothetical protein